MDGNSRPDSFVIIRMKNWVGYVLSSFPPLTFLHPRYTALALIGPVESQRTQHVCVLLLFIVLILDAYLAVRN